MIIVLALALAVGAGGGSDARAAAAAAEGEPAFASRIQRIDPELRDRMRGSSWQPGCPVGFADLRLITLRRWGMDGAAHAGRLVVHRDQARKIVRVMRRLFEVRFPIRRMWLIDAFAGSDRRSMRWNNTSAFNCRYVAGTTRWSQHAYGRAIDVNPVQNPYVTRAGRVSPTAGRRWANRAQRKPGMIHAGDRTVKAFATIGWKWGGTWRGAKDYQHFSSTGR